ncbi:MAG TPA: hypothetical protein VFI31_21400 [Pirellulales bacterium]|nr:hypothetical protein [Pirellulales bacterium]
MAEATALAERAELRVPAEQEPVVVGFRRNGAASVFFGAEPAYHFNTAGELRRAYVAGLLYKAERARLVSLRRQRVPGEVQLLRHDLTDEETSAFLAEFVSRLDSLRTAFSSGACRVLRQAPENADVLARIRRWLDSLSPPVAVAATPRVSN